MNHISSFVRSTKINYCNSSQTKLFICILKVRFLLDLDKNSEGVFHELYPGLVGTQKEIILLHPLSLLLYVFENKTLTSAPWLPPQCLTSGRNAELSASSSDRSVKTPQMAWTHPSSGPVTQPLFYFHTFPHKLCDGVLYMPVHALKHAATPSAKQ